MDTLTSWSLLIGALLPPVIAIIQRPGWSNAARSIVTVLICAVVGGLTAFVEGDLKISELTFGSIVGAAGVILIAAQTTHRNFWKPTGVSGAVEQATSPSDSDPEYFHEE